MSQHSVCDLCGGTMVQDATSLQVWHDKELVIVSDVPVQACQKCGQSRMSPEVSGQIDRFLENYDQYQPQRYIQVPEFSAAQILHFD